MTLEQISAAPPQELLNHIVTHLRSQGAPAFDILPTGRPSCRYRTNTGLACAVGCLFGTDYRPEFEGNSIEALLPWDSPTLHLLYDLQRAHDSFTVTTTPLTFLQHMENAFIRIAATHGLVLASPLDAAAPFNT